MGNKKKRIMKDILKTIGVILLTIVITTLMTTGIVYMFGLNVDDLFAVNIISNIIVLILVFGISFTFWD